MLTLLLLALTGVEIEGMEDSQSPSATLIEAGSYYEFF